MLLREAIYQPMPPPVQTEAMAVKETYHRWTIANIACTATTIYILFFTVMSYSELLKHKFAKTEVQEAAASWWGVGCPQKPFLLLLRAACGGGAREEKKVVGDTPRSGKGRLPFA